MSSQVHAAPFPASPPEVVLRPARLDDVAALEALQRTAVAVLNGRDYPPEALAAFLVHVGTLDRTLVRDGTYRVAVLGGRIVGCGGWSFRDQGVGGDGHGAPARRLRPGRDAAWMRAFFVDPAFAGRGIAGRLLRAAEADAAGAGFRRARLVATLTGEPLYLRHGYRVTQRIQVPAGGTSLAAAHMEKPL